MEVWLQFGLEPWRLDGLPVDTTDAGVLEYWYMRAWQYISARAEARAQIEDLSPEQREQRARAREMKRLHG